MNSELKGRFQAAVAEKRLPGVGAFLLGANGEFLYKEAFGTTNINDPAAPAFTFDTPMQLFSLTKLVTVIAALQLVELGKLSLSDPVQKHLPRIRDIQVLKGFQGQTPILRNPVSNVTIGQLFSHTSGFTYDAFDEPTLRYRGSTGVTPGGYGNPSSWADFTTPLATEPGTKYHYGIGIDWLGFVIQAITGTNLNTHLTNKVLLPLGMTKTGISYTGNRLFVHFRGADGALTANTALENNFNPEVVGGGAYLYGTLNDYAKLMGTILNKGKSPQTGNRVLKEATVANYIFKDLIPTSADRCLAGEITSFNPILSNSGTFIPTVPVANRGWGAFLLNGKDLPKGRKKGSGSWAGFGNLYYWIDPTTKRAGLIGTQVLPFMDRSVLSLFDAMERNAYGFPLGNGDGDGQGNFKLPA